ncbi:MAG: UvrD-helicase domain-containing protein [Veillonellaceae bacterium]|nr:UvrD-helicase domain-containing protein [Veillonellaceae bacterium]
MFIADLHIHSKYSRATSHDCEPEMLEYWARRKGIHLIGTGDFTHPAWRRELQEKLIPAGDGLYALRAVLSREASVAGPKISPQFIVSGEISSIYKKNGKVRKVHNLILLPSLDAAEAVSRRLETVGNLHSDGRPILGLDSRDLLEIVLERCPEAIFVPAHIWTPHFSLFGAYSGFDDIEECFGDLTRYIYALETGLSSDPPMNWRLSALDGFTLISNSDAHSPANLGRETNIFDTTLAYPNILQALKDRNANRFYGTLEFFPEEGKYHNDGHRSCKVCWQPKETKAAGGVCPVCGGRITVGVLHRVEDLADRPAGFVPATAKKFERLVPLPEVIAASVGFSASSKKVREQYEELLRLLGPELHILREASLPDIQSAAGPCIAEGIRRLREGNIEIEPGYDGEYGKIGILKREEIDRIAGQICLFTDRDDSRKKHFSPADKAAVGQKLSTVLSEVREENGPDISSATHPYGLNRQQWKAATADETVVAVVAGPGTGKTKTLIGRIAYLAEHRGVLPSQIAAVTFTNKAAREMRRRLAAHFGANSRLFDTMKIGTFHSLCLQVLAESNNAVRPVIIDEYQAVDLVGEIIRPLRLNVSPQDVLREISRRKNGVDSAAPGNASPIPDEVFEQYGLRLQQYGLMDFDDVLLAALQTETKSPAAFPYLLVDEFQDINEIQYRLIRQWSRQSNGVFVIGDPDQSIYGFRGSSSRCFERLAADYPGLRIVRLTRNYRSTPEIVAGALAAIAPNWRGVEREPLASQRKSGEKIRLAAAADIFSEATYITREINRLIGGMDMLDAHSLPGPGLQAKPASGLDRGFNDIAVLYRTNRQAAALEKSLRLAGIPHIVVGREDFLAEPPVREALAFFKFLLNPADLPALRLSLKSESQYTIESRQQILDLYAGVDKTLPALQKILQSVPPAPGAIFPLSFSAKLDQYSNLLHDAPLRSLTTWINDRGLGDQRCLDLLLNTAVMYENMADFVQNVLLGRDSDVVRSCGQEYAPQAVSLLTIHAAKGLEFPVVFVCGVNEGVIPLRSQRSVIDLEEERRLFYVAMTRAKDELSLVTSGVPSPFLSDIPARQFVREQFLPAAGISRYKQETLFGC